MTLLVTRLGRTGPRLGVGAVLLAALAGCMTIDGDLRISRDDTLSGAFVVAADRAALAAAGSTEQQFLDRMDAAMPTLRVPARRAARVEPYVTERLVGKRYVYDKVPMRSFDTGGAWRIRHSGGRYVVSGDVDISGIGRRGAGDAPGWSVTLRITFPGEVTRSNGDVRGRTVTWRPAFGQVTRVSAEATDRGSGPLTLARPGRLADALPWVLLLGAVGAAVQVAAVAAVVLLRRRWR